MHPSPLQCVIVCSVVRFGISTNPLFVCFFLSKYQECVEVEGPDTVVLKAPRTSLSSRLSEKPVQTAQRFRFSQVRGTSESTPFQQYFSFTITLIYLSKLYHLICNAFCKPFFVVLYWDYDSLVDAYLHHSSQTFVKVYGPDTTQRQMFDGTAKGLVKDVLEGGNSLIFTYGVTNAGKTFTFLGEKLSCMQHLSILYSYFVPSWWWEVVG